MVDIPFRNIRRSLSSTETIFFSTAFHPKMYSEWKIYKIKFAFYPEISGLAENSKQLVFLILYILIYKENNGMGQKITYRFITFLYEFVSQNHEKHIFVHK